MSIIYPLKMIPAYKDYVWGGTRLRDGYNKPGGLPVIAESWEVSTHPDGLSTIANGRFAGQTLRSVLERHPEMPGTNRADKGELPVLIKLIDAREPLSLQVHPDDDYARRTEGDAGKNEMWYVLEAKPGAVLILGFEKPADKAGLRNLIENGGLLGAVNHVPVKAGDCYIIPAGLLHAIGEGIVIAEVQQSSNVTYRVYDYNRADGTGRKRELHIDKALDVIDTAAQAQKAGPDVLTDWEYFRSEIITADTAGIERVRDSTSFECLLVTDGTLKLGYNKSRLELSKGNSVFIPAGMGRYTLEADRGTARILSTAV